MEVHEHFGDSSANPHLAFERAGSHPSWTASACLSNQDGNSRGHLWVRQDEKIQMASMLHSLHVLRTIRRQELARCACTHRSDLDSLGLGIGMKPQTWTALGTARLGLQSVCCMRVVANWRHLLKGTLPHLHSTISGVLGPACKEASAHTRMQTSSSSLALALSGYKPMRKPGRLRLLATSTARATSTTTTLSQCWTGLPSTFWQHSSDTKRTL